MACYLILSSHFGAGRQNDKKKANTRLATAFDVHHAYDNKLVACEIMATFYCWRVCTVQPSTFLVYIIINLPFFSLAQTWGHM
jgi:hypothetical protein